MNKSLQKGFTLIELLVVITIIGILSAIVLSSLGNARDRARDASIRTSLANLTNEAELNISSGGAYPADACDDGAAFDRIMDAVRSNAKDGDADCDVSSPNATAYRAFGRLNVADGTNDAFCVDSTGYRGPVLYASQPATASACVAP